MNASDFVKTIKRIINEEIKNITENILHLGKDNVPDDIRNWVKSILGKDAKHYRLHQNTTVSINMPGFEADRQYYQAFKLVSDGKFEKIGDMTIRSGWESDNAAVEIKKNEVVNVPVGGLVVKVSTYIGSADIYAGSGALPLIQSTDIDLTPTEALALYTAKTLKSFARPKFGDSVYQSLFDKGFMTKNKAITVAGRNATENPKVKEIIKSEAKINPAFKELVIRFTYNSSLYEQEQISQQQPQQIIKPVNPEINSLQKKINDFSEKINKLDIQKLELSKQRAATQEDLNKINKAESEK